MDDMFQKLPENIINELERRTRLLILKEDREVPTTEDLRSFYNGLNRIYEDYVQKSIQYLTGGAVRDSEMLSGITHCDKELLNRFKSWFNLQQIQRSKDVKETLSFIQGIMNEGAYYRNFRCRYELVYFMEALAMKIEFSSGKPPEMLTPLKESCKQVCVRNYYRMGKFIAVFIDHDYKMLQSLDNAWDLAKTVHDIGYVKEVYMKEDTLEIEICPELEVKDLF